MCCMHLLRVELNSFIFHRAEFTSSRFSIVRREEFLFCSSHYLRRLQLDGFMVNTLNTYFLTSILVISAPLEIVSSVSNKRNYFRYTAGADKFCDNIESMIKKRPHVYFKICWKYVSPIVSMVCITFFSHQHEH